MTPEEITHIVMSSNSPVRVEFHIQQAWMTANGLGLAVKHPRLGYPTQKVLKRIITTFEDAIIAVHPDTRDVIKHGKQDMGITRKAMSDDTPIAIDLVIHQAWMIIGGLQLTLRHPELPDTSRTMLTTIARTFQAGIVAVHPETEELLEMGWHEEYDR